MIVYLDYQLVGLPGVLALSEQLGDLIDHVPDEVVLLFGGEPRLLFINAAAAILDENVNDLPHTLDDILVQVVLNEVLYARVKSVQDMDRFVNWDLLQLFGNKLKTDEHGLFVEHVEVSVIYLDLNDVVSEVDEALRLGVLGGDVVRHVEHVVLEFELLRRGIFLVEDEVLAEVDDHLEEQLHQVLVEGGLVIKQVELSLVGSLIVIDKADRIVRDHLHYAVSLFLEG